MKTMQKGINQRIKILREKLKLSQIEFADSISIGQTTISKIESGITNLTERNIKEICAVHKVNYDWLVNSRGEIFAEQRSKAAGVPFYDLHATAGQVSLPNQDTKEIPEGYIDLPAFRGCDFALPVRGNSMANYINHGDVIICKRYDHTSYINFGHAFVIVTKQECMVKYVKKGKDEKHVELASENKEYDSFQLKLADILHLHIVKGVIKQTTF